MKTIRLKISGIHCKSCKGLIENEIDLLAGVSKVAVDVKKNIATVSFDDHKITPGEIIKEIEALNYGASLVGAELPETEAGRESNNVFSGIMAKMYG